MASYAPVSLQFLVENMVLFPEVEGGPGGDDDEEEGEEKAIMVAIATKEHASERCMMMMMKSGFFFPIRVSRFVDRFAEIMNSIIYFFMGTL